MTLDHLNPDVLLGRMTPSQAAQATITPPYPMDPVVELTPHTLTVEEGVAARTAFDLALRTKFTGMHEAICDLPEEALRDILLAVDVLGKTLQWQLDGRRVGRQLKLAQAILQPDSFDIKTSQHCTAVDCEYTHSHTAEWCGRLQPDRCGCAFCYPESGVPS